MIIIIIVLLIVSIALFKNCRDKNKDNSNKTCAKDEVVYGEIRFPEADKKHDRNTSLANPLYPKCANKPKITDNYIVFVPNCEEKSNNDTSSAVSQHDDNDVIPVISQHDDNDNIIPTVPEYNDNDIISQHNDNDGHSDNIDMTVNPSYNLKKDFFANSAAAQLQCNVNDSDGIIMTLNPSYNLKKQFSTE